MTQKHTSRESKSRYIDRVWASQNISDGMYKATPDGCWDLIVMIARDGSRHMALTGQASKTTLVPYTKGTSSIVISFAAGAFIPQIIGTQMLDLIEMLPRVDEDRFQLLGHTFDIPTFDTAELLVEQMVKAKILDFDEVVAAVLNGTPKAMSDRNMQRHFSKATGLTYKSLAQIHRAQHAVALLKTGLSPTQAAADAGYVDQSHLTHSLKRLMHSRPRDVEDIHKL